MKTILSIFPRRALLIGPILLLIHCTSKKNESENQAVAEKKDPPAEITIPAPVIDSITVRDIDGTIYHTVTLGKQVWMVENLNVTRFRNADKIPNLKDDKPWTKLSPGPGYCNYNNDAAMSNVYGRLYNWFAVNDSRKIAPEGWHIPTNEEWNILISHLGGYSLAGGKLKEAGTAHWDAPNTGASNHSLLTALASGERNNDGTFTNIGFSGGWWSATGSDGDFASTVNLICNSGTVTFDIDDMRYGYSVRCVKDK